MPLDSNASIDGRAVTTECAEPRRGLKTVSKLLRPLRTAFGAAGNAFAAQIADRGDKSLDFQTVSFTPDSCPYHRCGY